VYFKTAVGAWGWQPSEFWRSTLHEFWATFDAKMGPEYTRPRYGNLSERDVDELRELL
jgi:hypothetical protein